MPQVTTPDPLSRTTDARLDALSKWLASVAPGVAAISPASADASFRRYFRVTLQAPWHQAAGSATLIAMDAPPPHEDCRPYVHVARLLRNGGVHVPQIVAANIAEGYLLMSDLGSTTYASVLGESNASQLYGDAVDALVLMQRMRCEDELPPYDDALLRRELALFPDWYVAHHLQRTLDTSQRASLGRIFDVLVANNLAQPRVFVHRDYHSRNLMVTAPNPGVLDFQDAVYGPITYDLVSLLRDAYIDWSEEHELDRAIRYWERARQAGLPVSADFAGFWRDFEWMGVQRQLKVLGIFARLKHRDGKAGYVGDMPRVMRYLRRAAARYRELAPLLALLDALENRTPGYVPSL
jgi:N-acetylmuramate 1-kinase